MKMKNKDIDKIIDNEEFAPLIALVVVIFIGFLFSMPFFSESSYINMIKVTALISFIISFLLIEYLIFISMEKDDGFIIFILFNLLNLLFSIVLAPVGLMALMLIWLLVDCWKGILIVIGSLSAILLIKYLIFKTFINNLWIHNN